MNLEIVYQGQIIGELNKNLVEKNQLSPAQVEKLKRLHVARHELFLEMEATDEPGQLYKCGKVLEQIEFDMQDAWRVPRNANNHTWWFRAPKCLCAKSDNRERIGTPFRVVDSGCPVHQEPPLKSKPKAGKKVGRKK